jgi:O-antigen/teichoic acid export membrane protein
VVSGFIFLLIILNINELYRVLPKEFTGGLVVVIIISIAKLYDNMLGNNNAILFNSEYYRMVLVFGVVLTVLAVVLNLICIPMFGINGSAIATFLAIGIYNTVKVLFVQKKFNMQPFSIASLKILAILIITSLLFYFWEFPFHPVINILLKSTLIGVLYLSTIYKLNISDDMSLQIKKYLKL